MRKTKARQVHLFTYTMLFSFFILFMIAPITYPYMTQRFFIFKDTENWAHVGAKTKGLVQLVHHHDTKERHF